MTVPIDVEHELVRGDRRINQQVELFNIKSKRKGVLL